MHRQHAQVEDRVKTLKTSGASHLPFHSFAANAAWLELALTAHDITVWTQLLTLDGEHRICEPKRLRYRILHVLPARTHLRLSGRCEIRWLVVDVGFAAFGNG